MDFLYVVEFTHQHCIKQEFCFIYRAKQLDRVEPFLEALREQGLSIPLSVAQFVRETLEITSPSVRNLLSELSSGELIPKKLDPHLTPLQWTNSAQVIKRKKEFCMLARERKLNEALASKKVLCFKRNQGSILTSELFFD